MLLIAIVLSIEHIAQCRRSLFNAIREGKIHNLLTLIGGGGHKATILINAKLLHNLVSFDVLFFPSHVEYLCV